MKTTLLFALITFHIIGLNTKKSFAKENVSISGKVKDAQQKTLDFVTISLLSSKDSSIIKTAITDLSGSFVFNLVKSGAYLLRAQQFGYKEVIVHCLVKETNIILPDIILYPESKNLAEVVVSAKKPLIERKADKMVMNVESSTLAVGSNALEVLQRAPGVTVDQNDQIALQGKQGVNIMLDGKMTFMSNADVVTLLKSMQSSEIETIELITNPSSKYDASGNAGIINIKRKKGKGLGTNGNFNGNVSKGINYRNNVGFSVNHRSKRSNVFGNYNYSKFNNDQVLGIDRISSLNNADLYFSQISNNFDANNNHNFKAGADFFINSKNTIGLMLNGNFSNGISHNVSNTLVGNSFSNSDSIVFVDGNSKKNYKNLSYNANYKLTIDSLGQEISADADYSNFISNESSYYDNFYLNTDRSTLRSPWFINNQSPSNIDIKAIKADYSKPLSKTFKIDAGLKSSWVKTDNDLKFTQLNNKQWENLANRSNHFIYTENINAAYLNVNKEFSFVNIQFGLRTEHTHSKGNLITNKQVVERDYVNLFPNVSFSKALGKNNDVTLSYSRRINRPNYDALNPFIFYLDQYTYSKGNPFLNPEFANNIELGYTFKKMYNLTLNYTITNNPITQILLPDNSNKSLFQTTSNLNKQINYGANFNAPITIAKWWTSSNNFGAYYMGFRADDLQGQNLNTGKIFYQINSQHNFTINKTVNAEFSGDYTSSLIYGTIKIKPVYMFNTGISKNFKQNKYNLKLTLTDIFNTNRQKISSAYTGLEYKLNQKNETQFFRLSFTYKFGSNEVKPERNRNTGLENEQRRLKN